MYSDAPKHLPAFSTLRDGMGNPSAAALAKHLGVTARTVNRWIEADAAPRAVCLAMFWETTWGRSAVECRAVNDAVLQAGLARCHKEEAEKRLRELQHLLTVGQFGSANGPLLDVRPTLQVVHTEPDTARQRDDGATPIAARG